MMDKFDILNRQTRNRNNGLDYQYRVDPSNYVPKYQSFESRNAQTFRYNNGDYRDSYKNGHNY